MVTEFAASVDVFEQSHEGLAWPDSNVLRKYQVNFGSFDTTVTSY